MAELAPKLTLRSSRSTDAKSSVAPVADDVKKKMKLERWESFFLSFFRFYDKEIEKNFGEDTYVRTKWCLSVQNNKRQRNEPLRYKFKNPSIFARAKHVKAA